MGGGGVIDLHLHTTASDGRCSPTTLVSMATRAGIQTMSVTDHDTVAGLREARQAAEAAGIAFVDGIEITAVAHGRDVHMLGYFFDPENDELAGFLALQRADRMRRASEMADRLAALGKPIDRDGLLAPRGGGRSLGRPQIAQALVTAGHVDDMRQAFDELIGEGKPAYVARRGPEPSVVIELILRAGGISSLAHPGLLKRDDIIPPLAEAGLVALEAYHSDHDPATTDRYLLLARQHGLAVSGGSDYHGDDGRRKLAFGKVGLPSGRFETLSERAQRKDA
jgi:predicted metal-dependent phosphoesterase TrpH